ncbi:ABC transporter substrate-binding protein [Halosegnis marinus]|uniref:ABC transporter substrate-binding protein n=1 Tax=Halosegnis marinus TaxID=3034023 RepID=UPI0036154C8A
MSTFSQTTATADSEITEKTVPYADAYAEKYDGALPVYTGYSAYDAVYMLKDAIESGESVDSDTIVSELESMTFTGTSGTLEFFGEDGDYPHDIKYGEEYTRGVYFQWQPEGESGTQSVVWPDEHQQSEYQAPPWQ